MLQLASLVWASLLMGGGNALDAKCGCTMDTLPDTRIVLLGSTGVGKSTFGNRLFNISDDNDNEAVCSQSGQEVPPQVSRSPHRFGVGHRADAMTTNTSYMVGHYMGNPDYPCIAVIDTPGSSDTECRDHDHMYALAAGIKNIGSVTAFVLHFNGQRPRFEKSLQEQVKLYQTIFGPGMWSNVITEFTFWQHDRKSIMKRKKKQKKNMEIQHTLWNKEYRRRFGVNQTIPTVFVDPVFDAELADEDETFINQGETDKLWTLLTQNFTAFECENRCKAPPPFFSGVPWLLEDTSVQYKRLQDRTVFTWQIWDDGCGGNGTKSYNISHVTLDQADQMTQARVLYVHEVPQHTIEERTGQELVDGMEISDDPKGKYRTISLIIDSTEEQHFGSFFVENEKGRSEVGQLHQIVDGKWQAWGRWGSCSKPCWWDRKDPRGQRTRNRRCTPPENGGRACPGDSVQSVPCGDTQCFFSTVWDLMKVGAVVTGVGVVAAVNG